MTNLYIKQNLNQEWRKHFLNGEDVSSFGVGNSWKSVKTIKWENFGELEEQLLPYIVGEDDNANHCALMIGETEEYFARNKANVKDEKLNHLLLDIETELPKYEKISTDLPKIREWMIDQYEWLDEKTGMFLFFSNSAGIHCGDKHKQIRVRAIVKIDKALNEEERIGLLKDFTKRNTKESREYHHLDETTLRRHIASIIAQPKVENTEAKKIKSRTLVWEGNPIATKSISSSYTPPTQNDGRKTTSEVLSKETREHFNNIEKNGTYDTVWRVAFSCIMRGEDRFYWEEMCRNKCKEINSDRNVKSTFNWANTKIKSWFFLHDKLNEDNKHNYIKLNRKYISDEGVISWKKNRTIFVKSPTATGKTTALKKLIEDNKDKSILYIGDGVCYVVNAAATLDLDDYKDYKKFPYYNELGYKISNRNLFKSTKLAVCYNSIKYLYKPNGKLAKFDIVIIDEARHLLGYSATSRTILDKEQLSVIMGDLVREADLVVCLDADLDNLVVKAIEIYRGEDDCFDIYDNIYDAFRGKTAYMCRSPSEVISKAVQLIKAKKTFAFVGDFSPKLSTNYSVEYFEKLFRANGLKEKEIFSLSSANSDKKEQQEVLQNPNKYLVEKLQNGLRAFIATPSITCGWDFKNDDKNFDYVLGFYPSAILTATGIVQQLRRFRDTDDFFLWIKPTNHHTGYEMEKLKDIWQELYGDRTYDNRAEIKRTTQLDKSGLDWRFREVIRASKVSYCNLKLNVDLIWRENGGMVELSPYFDEFWQEAEGVEVMKKDKRELQKFYDIASNEWEKVKKGIKYAKTISPKEYRQLLLET